MDNRIDEAIDGAEEERDGSWTVVKRIASRDQSIGASCLDDALQANA